MPRKADKFPFSREQEKSMHSFFPEFARVVKKHDPSFTGRNSEVTKWKKERAQAHLDDPLFNELDPSQTRAKWQEAIMRFYGNHFNNHIKKDKPTISVATEEVSEGGVDPKNRKIALLLLSAGIPPKTLFSLDRDEEISALAKEIRDQNPDLKLSGGAAKSLATTELWDKEDRDVWEKKVQARANDVVENRKEFRKFIPDSLQQMIADGYLGSTIMSLSYGFRDDNNKLSGVGFDSISKKLFASKFDECEESNKTWLDHVRKTLPAHGVALRDNVAKPHQFVTNLLRNDEGLPLFPIFDRKIRTYLEVTQILSDYLISLWEHTQEGSIDIPWDRINVNPDLYYDTWKYALPCKLSCPEDMDEIEVMRLTKYFAEESSVKPFTFFCKDDVESNISRFQMINDFAPPSPPVNDPDLTITPSSARSSPLPGTSASIPVTPTISRRSPIRNDASQQDLPTPPVSEPLSSPLMPAPNPNATGEPHLRDPVSSLSVTPVPHPNAAAQSEADKEQTAHSLSPQPSNSDQVSSGAPRDGNLAKKQGGKSTVGKRKRASKSDASLAVEKSTSLRRSGRERQAPPSGPTLVADPSRPPAKRIK
ncbi:hypothetical protein BDN70DRAFT_939038 [Pholiota conissans]|uniref:Uncharacterized protein n=1 Tax=Pholiota conissans TaxID=109636 RepID=A0A9P5YLW5_9AGAR|nr:hypothetical protein BDN70DRAFT_939038 [Pholiota conissans]